MLKLGLGSDIAGGKVTAIGNTKASGPYVEITFPAEKGVAERKGNWSTKLVEEFLELPEE